MAHAIHESGRRREREVEVTERESSPVDEWSGLTRRRFLERSAGVAGGLTAAAAVGGSGLLESASALAASAPVALTAAELATLTAVLTQLLPADSLGPGAVEAGVPAYIDRALAGSYRNLLPVYRGLLAAVRQGRRVEGRHVLRRALADGRAGRGDRRVRGGQGARRLGVGATLGKRFIQLLLAHMREGMFADPMYGGNRHLAGWKLLGYPGIQLRPTAADQRIGAVVGSTGEGDRDDAPAASRTRGPTPMRDRQAESEVRR